MIETSPQPPSSRGGTGGTVPPLPKSRRGETPGNYYYYYLDFLDRGRKGRERGGVERSTRSTPNRPGLLRGPAHGLTFLMRPSSTVT